MTKLIGLLATAGAAALIAGAANAQTDVDALIVTAPDYVSTGGLAANKSPVPLVETPQSVTVISRDQIDLLDWNNLSQTARYVAGVTGENYGPDERVDWLTLRGFNPVQYIDGLQSAIGSITNTGLDLYGSESVEILKGPSSALYGTTPPGGIVNLTSRRPQDTFGGEIEVQAGNRDHLQGNLDLTGPLSDTVSGRLTALVRSKGTQTRGVDSDRVYVAPALTFRPTDATRITLLSYYQDDEVTGDGGGFLPAYGVLLPNPLGEVSSTINLGETSYNRFKREHYGIGYDAEHKLSDTLTLSQNLKFSHLDGDQRGVGGNGLVDNNFDGVPDDYRTVNRYSFSFAEDVDVFAVDTRLNGTMTTGGLTHQFVGGVDYRRYDYVGSSAFGFGIPSIDLFQPVYGLAIPALPPVTFSDQLQTQAGLYALDQIKAGKLMVNLSLRHDWVETKDRATGGKVDDAEFSYRAGLSYEIAPGLIPYAAYSKSFQPVAGTDRGGSPFDPTTGEQIEGGIKFEQRSDTRQLFATAAVYKLTQQNVLTPDPANGAGQSFNIQTGEVEVKGVELEAVARFNERLSLNASYSYTDSEVTRSNGPDLGNRLPVVPKHKISALADYTFQDGAFRGLGGSFGVRYTSDTAGNLAASYQPVVFINPSVTLFDASVHYDLNDWRLAVTASNLFDKEYVARCYSTANCFFGVRRVVVASVTRKF
ncbi:TonB-dependent siderophore receptor [Caulobacter sp. NIBR2454]|uniref:TonB-dependent siderophore receptor n=1 Tax=Caulobacter sp. NIBR2454 TaxID=3015996 RepID=UPI0022B613E6|nr:TonB-dependent siderophore receptor [Caulobacter sp. NIBR2454]